MLARLLGAWHIRFGNCNLYLWSPLDWTRLFTRCVTCHVHLNLKRIRTMVEMREHTQQKNLGERGEREKEDKYDNFSISSVKRIKWNIISQNSHSPSYYSNGRYICHLVNGIKRFAIMNIQFIFSLSLRLFIFFFAFLKWFSFWMRKMVLGCGQISFRKMKFNWNVFEIRGEKRDFHIMNAWPHFHEIASRLGRRL